MKSRVHTKVREIDLKEYNSLYRSVIDDRPSLVSIKSASSSASSFFSSSLKSDARFHKGLSNRDIRNRVYEDRDEMFGMQSSDNE